MSKEVTKHSEGALAAVAALKRGIQNTRQAIPASASTPILRMGTDGIWVYGQGNVEVEEGSRWAINPRSIQHGFVCWTNKAKGEGKNELLGEVYAPMTSEPIDMNKLPDYGWPWKPATSVQLRCISGEDVGETVVYKPSSVGGANVMQKLLDAIEKQLDTGSAHIVPVVLLENDHYQHKQYGKTYVPLFEVVDWVTMDDPDDVEGGDKAPAPEPAQEGRKKKKTTKRPEPEPEDVDEDEGEDEDNTPEAPDVAQPAEGRVRRRRRSA